MRVKLVTRCKARNSEGMRCQLEAGGHRQHFHRGTGTNGAAAPVWRWEETSLISVPPPNPYVSRPTTNQGGEQ